MARIPLPKGNDDEAVRALGLSPAFGNAIATYSGAIYGDITLSMREREAVRMRIAQINQCAICLGYRFPELQEQGVSEGFYGQVEQWKNCDEFSEREKLAIDYTERFLQDHLNINDEFFNLLNQHFSAKEVFELTSIIAGLMANGRLMQVLQLDQQCALD